jgi:acetyl-CoA carboxylase carboxyl transferase subunit beta
MAWFQKTKFTPLRPPAQSCRIPGGIWVKCPQCLEILIRREWEEHLRVCPRCGFHDRLSARERLALLLDEGSFIEADATLVSADPLGFSDLKPYPQRIQESMDKTGELDAVISGLGRIEGEEISIAVMDFDFSGGSMGAVVGEKITRSLERALARRLPALTVCASGGARMQEGIFSLMQMAKTAALVGRLGQARLPYLVLLTHPVTGGVTASFAMLGDVILAEPGALVGFAGPRVIEATLRQSLPPGFQTAEFVRDHGFIDMVVPRGELKATLARVIKLLTVKCPMSNVQC